MLDIKEISKFNSNWWIARYGNNNGQADYTYKPAMANIGWQYTSVGTVPGINGNVDLNEYYEELGTITQENPATCEQGTKYSVGQKVSVSSYYVSSAGYSDLTEDLLAMCVLLLCIFRRDRFE